MKISLLPKWILPLGIILLPWCTPPTLAQSKMVTAGEVRAEFTSQKGDFCLTNPRLKIVRKGKVVVDQPPAHSKVEEACRLADLRVVNLDKQAEPEVVLDLYTGGAHCCTYSLIYTFNPQTQKYQVFRHDWGNVGYRLSDLNGDRVMEFVSADDRFAYLFAPYAASAFPLQIWRLGQGKLVDITRQYPRQIYADATQHWQAYVENRKACDPTSWGSCGEGLLAAYLADKYLLGQGEDGWQRLRAQYQGKGCQFDGKCSGAESFFRQLRDFLQKSGYIR